MNQPPTIPEGDEENEGFEQGGEGTRFPQKNATQQVPPIHDTQATASDLQTREDSGVGYGQTPTLPNEIVAASGGDTTHAEQGADYEQPSAVEGEPTSVDGERVEEKDAPGHLDESGPLEGVYEEEPSMDESARAAATDRSMPTLVESPIPPLDEHAIPSPPPETSRDHLKPGETIVTHPDEHRRSARSGRERSGRGQREGPQVDFERVDHDDEQEQEPEIEGPEIRISREQLLSRYQAAEIERDRLKGINLALQQRLADYLHKRKGEGDIPALAQGNDRLNAEQQQRYQKYLSEIEALQRKMKEEQIKHETHHNELEYEIQRKKNQVEHLKSDYVKLVKEIASKAVFARSGKAISNQEVEHYLTSLREKEEELIKARHENIRLKNQLKKREAQLKSKEELAEGLHMIDFEQLKIENQTYSEKIEERNEELMKLRKKISTTVQILSHIKEKLSFVQEQRAEAEAILEDKEKEVKQKRDELATIKRRRDRLRQENQSLKQNSGLIGNEQLLRDYEERYDDIERCTAKLENLKKRHAEVTLMCKVLKKKISKV